jgi:hypothetical protein
MTTDDTAPQPTAAEHAVVTTRLPAEESTAVAVVFAVADALDCDPVELESLSTRVDPEALDTMTERAAGTGSKLSISFSFAGCAVTVTPARIRVRRRVGESGERRERSTTDESHRNAGR